MMDMVKQSMSGGTEMATTVRITYYGMDGGGATLREAKADAA